MSPTALLILAWTAISSMSYLLLISVLSLARAFRDREVMLETQRPLAPERTARKRSTPTVHHPRAFVATSGSEENEMITSTT